MWQQNHYARNLDIYVQKHPEEFIVIEGSHSEVRETFFSKKENLKEYLKKYDGRFGCTFFVGEIPHPSLVDKIDELKRMYKRFEINDLKKDHLVL